MAPHRDQDRLDWETHKPIIRYLYLVEDFGLTELVAALRDRGIQVTTSQVEYQLAKWRFRKNLDRKCIPYLKNQVARHTQRGAEPDVFLSARLVPRKEWKRKLQRQHVSILERVKPGPEPTVPEHLDLLVSAPAPLPLQFSSWPERLPWLRSNTSISAVASAVASTMLKHGCALGAGGFTFSALTTYSGSKALTSNSQTPENLSIAAAVIGKTMPETFEGENFIRASVLSNSHPDHETIMEAVKVMLFRLSNNLDRVDSTPILDLLTANGIWEGLSLDTVISTNEWTLAAVTDKIFHHALSQGDDDIKAIECLRRLPLHRNINHPAVIQGIYQMPLQAAIRKGALKLTKVLIHCGADVNTTFGNLLPLVQCARGKDHDRSIELSRVLVLSRKLANESMQLNSAMLVAASKCNAGLVKFLIESGASVDYCKEADSESPFSKITVLVNALNGPETDISTNPRGWRDIAPSSQIDSKQDGEKRLQLATYLLHPERDYGEPFTPRRPAVLVADALIAACLSGNAAAIKLLHDNGVDLNACNAKLLRPLRAAMLGGLEAFTLIQKLGANLDELPRSDRVTLLRHAARRGYAPILKSLLQHSVEVDGPASPYWGKRPSLPHLAAMSGSLPTIDLLVHHGVDVNLTIDLSDAGDWAISSKSYYHVDVDSRLRYATTALQVALCKKDYYCTARILQLGAKASHGDLISAIKSDEVDLVKGVLLAGGNLYETDGNSHSVLEIARKGGCSEIIDLIEQKLGKAKITRLAESFLKGDIEWGCTTELGESILDDAVNECTDPENNALLDSVLLMRPMAYDPGALCRAVFNVTMKNTYDLSVVERLLRHRCPREPSNVVEGSAVALAAMGGDSECVDLLLRYIPVTQQCCRLPYKSKYDALADTSTEYFWYLVSEDQPFWHSCQYQSLRFSLIFAAVRGKNRDIVHKLLGAGFIPDTLALLAALTCGEESMANLGTELFQRGTRIRCSIKVYGILTPLQAAVWAENEELVRILLAAGADVNARAGSFGVYSRCAPRTALQMAVEIGNERLISILLDSGADVNAKASGRGAGATALQLAAIKGFLGIARLLLEKGADPNAPRALRLGRTALEGAAEHGRLDMVQLLLSNWIQIEGKGRRQYIRAIKFAQKSGHQAVEGLLKEQRHWSEEDLKMLEEEELIDDEFYDQDEWSDEDDMDNYLCADDAPYDEEWQTNLDELESSDAEDDGCGVAENDTEDQETQNRKLANEEMNDQEMHDEEVHDEEVHDEEMHEQDGFGQWQNYGAATIWHSRAESVMGHEDLRDAGLPECRMPTSIEEDIAVGIDNYEGSWEGFGSASWDDFFDALK